MAESHTIERKSGISKAIGVARSVRNFVYERTPGMFRCDNCKKWKFSIFGPATEKGSVNGEICDSCCDSIDQNLH